MNNSGAYTRIISNLEFLKSKESLDVIDRTLDYVTTNNLSFVDGFLYFTEQQVERKKQNIIQHSVQMAGFPRIKSLAEFDFDYQPSINQQQIYDLNSLRFVEKQENIVFYGNSGVGKTHLATAIGLTAAQNRFSTYFIKCAELMDSLHKANMEGRLAERLKKLCGYKVLIIDELGYLPVDKEATYGFFQLIAARYEHRPTIITTNQSFAKWGEVFGDAVIANAIIDRLVHHSEIVKITGPSYRVKDRTIFDEDFSG